MSDLITSVTPIVPAPSLWPSAWDAIGQQARERAKTVVPKSSANSRKRRRIPTIPRITSAEDVLAAAANIAALDEVPTHRALGAALGIPVSSAREAIRALTAVGLWPYPSGRGGLPLSRALAGDPTPLPVRFANAKGKGAGPGAVLRAEKRAAIEDAYRRRTPGFGVGTCATLAEWRKKAGPWLHPADWAGTGTGAAKAKVRG